MFFDMTRLAMDANIVVGLRMMRLAEGGAGAIREAELMVSEKIQTAVMLTMQNAVALGTGTSVDRVGKTSLAKYQKVVSANKRRLSRR
jgi:hypothetical protein